MTDKLYYDDTACLEFTAEVVTQDVTQRGTAVSLDRTAFYPTSGGQPYDTGTINDVPVIDVWEDDRGEVWHLLEHSLSDKVVIGRIDQARRLDHIQQHTGQHILSAGFFNLCQANTIGFHLGTKLSTIDLDVPELSWQTAYQVEAQVNAVVWEDRPVTISYVTDDKIDQVPLRKPAKVKGNIRVIWVEDYDASACGGTHARITGEVGLIKITGIEHYKGGIRISFLCGQRAFLDYQHTLRTLQSAGESLSVAQFDVADAVQRLQKELTSIKKAYNKVQSALLDIEAERLWSGTSESDGVRYVIAHWTDKSFNDIRRIANQMRDHPKTVLLFAVTERKGVRLVCARSDDVPRFDARQILNVVLEKLDGKGGGSPFMAQGGSPMHSKQEVQTALNEAISPGTNIVEVR